MRYKIKKEYGRNTLGQRYNKRWKIIDTQTGTVVDSGNRDNLGRASRELKRLNSEHNEQKVLSENQEKVDEYGIKKIGDKWVDARGNEHDTVEGAIAGATRYDVSKGERGQYGVGGGPGMSSAGWGVTGEDGTIIEIIM